MSVFLITPFYPYVDVHNMYNYIYASLYLINSFSVSLSNCYCMWNKAIIDGSFSGLLSTSLTLSIYLSPNLTVQAGRLYA